MVAVVCFDFLSM